jgi:hypothetical protein
MFITGSALAEPRYRIYEIFQGRPNWEARRVTAKYSTSEITVCIRDAAAALSRFIRRMTTDSSFESYYTKYAPRTYGLPPPVPLHQFPRGREFYKNIGEPKKIVAPMVDQSELVSSNPGK